MLGGGGGHSGQDGVGGAQKPWGQDAESRTREEGERRAGEEPQDGGRLAGGGWRECPACVCPHAAPGPLLTRQPRGGRVFPEPFRPLQGRVPWVSSVRCSCFFFFLPRARLPAGGNRERMKRALTRRASRHPQARPCRSGAPCSPVQGPHPPGRRFSPGRPSLRPGPSPSSESRVLPQALPALPNPLGSRSRPKEPDLWRLKPNVPLTSRRLRAVPTGRRPDSLPTKRFVLGPSLRLQSRRPGSCRRTQVGRAGPEPTPQGGLRELPADRGPRLAALGLSPGHAHRKTRGWPRLPAKPARWAPT